LTDRDNRQLNVVDLFAGAGGFSCGLEQTGVFKVILALEIHKQYRATFKANHQDVHVLGDINRVLQPKTFSRVTKALLKKHGSIDVIIGGPPCQGFSNANRQRNHLISTNNLLVSSFMRFVDLVEPKAFVMENVAELPRYSFYVSTDPWDQSALRKSGVELHEDEVILGHAGEHAPLVIELLRAHLVAHNLRQFQFAESLSTLYPPFRILHNYIKRGKNQAAERFINLHRTMFRRQLKALQSGSTRLPEFVTKPMARLVAALSDSAVDPLQIPLAELPVVVTLLSILAQALEIHSNRVRVVDFEQRSTGDIVVHLQSYNLAEQLTRYFARKGYKVVFDVREGAQYGVPQRRQRVFLIGVRESELRLPELQLPKPILETEQAYYTVRDAILDLQDSEPSTNTDDWISERSRTIAVPPLAEYLRGQTQHLYNHVRTDSTGIAQMRYEALRPGQNFHDLPPHLTDTYSDPGRTQRNIYHRLDFRSPSPTVTNVRKAMWIHPEIPRAISIREAARLQSFPDYYKFYGTKNDQYQQVGNAVPPILARAIGEALAQALGYDPSESLAQVLRSHPKVADNPVDCQGVAY